MPDDETLANEPGPSHARPADPPTDERVQRHPDDWKTGDEPMTAAQSSYLQTLCQETGEDFDPELTKAEASKRIDELRAKTGRGG